MEEVEDFVEQYENVDDWSMGHWVSSVLGVIFWVFVAYMIYYCCCRKKKNQGTVFTTVQTIPATTTTTVQHGNVIHTNVIPSQAVIGRTAPYPVQHPPMPAPYPQAAPYPQPYQQPGPYPAAGPYPNAMPQPYGAPYPGGSGQQAYPPPYEQVVGQDVYQKQAPYNPNFSGN